MDRRRFPLPTFTNREDLLLSVAANDDDTGQPIDLAGITLAPLYSNGFTGSNWMVTMGMVVSPSTTTLTIPGYPITNQLLAVALVINPGLAVPSGQQVEISDPTGANTMNGYVTSYNSATGNLVCQIGWSFQFEIRPRRPNEAGQGYVTWYDFGVQSDEGPILSAALGTGVYIADVGVVQINIPEAQFRKLSGTTYVAALTMTDSVHTRQMFLADLPVLQGFVSI